MRILYAASFNSGHFAPFIVEQANSICELGHEVDFFGIKGKGVWGYLSNYKLLLEKISEFKPDIIHAHYGLSGLLCNLQRKIPVVTTYHGSDINDKRVRAFSRMAMKLSAWNVFVSKRTQDMVNPKRHCSLVPCGVDTEIFMPLDNVKSDVKFVLFAGAFDNSTKNVSLARSAVDLLNSSKDSIKLVELKGYSRVEVAELMNRASCLLLTSLAEGSPQVVKEAMSCNLPVVSVDVGDVMERLEGVENCYVTQHDARQLADALGKVLNSGGRSNGRERILSDGLSLQMAAKKIEQIYKQL